MAPLYYRGALAAIVVFDLTDVESFNKLKEWVRELKANVEHDLVLAIACNKADLAQERQVSFDTASEYAASIGALVFETSAKENTGVDKLFTEVATRLAAMHHRARLHLPGASIAVASHRGVLEDDGRRRNCC